MTKVTAENFTNTASQNTFGRYLLLPI